MAQHDAHEVAFVTKRYESEPIELPQVEGMRDIKIYYMARRDKIHCPFNPDIWIDNNPFDITGYP